MTRQSFQQGYVSNPIHTRRGIAFKIRFRIRGKDGRWEQKSETLYGISGKKAVRAVLSKRIQEASVQKPEVRDLSFRDFVETYWKPYLDRKQVKPSTRLSYQSGLDRHIMPVLGEQRLADIAPLHIEELLRQKMGGSLSPKTVRNLLVLLQGIFALAEDNDLIARSPVRNRHKPEVRRQEKSIWNRDQVRKILEAARPQYRALFVCVGLTGVRLGELLAIQWKHVDFENRVLRIEQSLWRGEVVPPKTEGSVRSILFGETLARILNKHLQGSSHIGPNDFVFCKSDSKPFNPDVLRKDVLYPVLDRLGIVRTARASGFHTFRHSAASLINAETGNVKLAQKLLGHSNFSTTADTYTHTYSEGEREAAKALERAVFGESVPSCSQNGEQEQGLGG